MSQAVPPGIDRGYPDAGRRRDSGRRCQILATGLHDEATVVPGHLAAAGSSGGPSSPAGASDLADFSRSLIELGLIDAEELESRAVETAEGVLGLSRNLVNAGRLTAYQAAAIYQKKSRGLLIGNYIILDKIGQGGMGDGLQGPPPPARPRRAP